MLNESIKKLVTYGMETGLVPECERNYTINLLLDLFHQDDYEEPQEEYTNVDLESTLKEQSINYSVRQTDFDFIIGSANLLLKEEAQAENKRILYKNIQLKKFSWLNFIGVEEKRNSITITISFSYSRYDNNDNYKLAKNKKVIAQVHQELILILRSITGELVREEDIVITSLDLSNQLEVENIRNYYQVLNLIYRAYKNIFPTSRMYFDTDNKKRLELDGVDFREKGKRPRDSKAYFKIYSKRKEMEDTGKEGVKKRQALRGELTLRPPHLKTYNLNHLGGITKDNLAAALRKTIGAILTEQIVKELNYDITELKKIVVPGTKGLAERLMMKEYLIFDIRLLDVVMTENNMSIKKRAIQYQKKKVIEKLEELEKLGEIKKTYSKNFERLEKLLKKIAKVSIKIRLGEEGATLEWQE